jgi:hypothetical protein
VGPRARITTDDGGGIDQAVASEQLPSPVKATSKARARVGRLATSGEIIVILVIIVTMAKAVVMIVVAVAVAVAVATEVVETTETTAASSR